jgi:hypothetical protein
VQLQQFSQQHPEVDLSPYWNWNALTALLQGILKRKLNKIKENDESAGQAVSATAPTVTFTTL